MKWTRTRTASALALGTASALLLSACSSSDDKSSSAPKPTDTNTETPKEDVTLTVAFWGNFGLENLAAQYQADNPHVKIELNSGDHAAQHDVLTQALIAGSGAANVAAIDADFITGFVARADSFVNLLDLGAGKYKDNYLSWKWADASTADGEVTIGLGSDIGGLALCYRADLFDAAGLPTDRDAVAAEIGGTWDGFIELGKKYQEGAADGLFFVDNATNILTPRLTQLNIGYYNRNNELELEPAKPAFDLALQIFEEGLSANISPWSPEWNEGFSGGKFATLACPAWMLGYIQGQISADSFAGKWDVTDIPGEGGNWGGSWYTVPNQGTEAQKLESYKFIEWLIQPEQQIAIFQEVGNLPSQSVLYDREELLGFESEFFSGAPIGKIFTDSAAKIPGPVYYAPKHNAIRTAVESTLNEVQSGSVSIADAWDRAKEAAIAADAA